MANPLGIGGQKAGEPGRNPTGKHSTGYQDPKTRLDNLAEHKTRQEILDVVNDPKKFNALNSTDAGIYKRLAKQAEDDGLPEFKEIWDRRHGKPKADHEIMLRTTDMSEAEIDKRVNALLGEKKTDDA